MKSVCGECVAPSTYGCMIAGGSALWYNARNASAPNRGTDSPPMHANDSAYHPIYPRPLAILMLLAFTALLTWLAAHPATAQDDSPLTRATANAVAGCTELLLNGGFEAEGLGWEQLVPGLPPSLAPAYVAAPVYGGTRALKVGIVEGDNSAITNGVYQTVSLPRTASPIVLGFTYLPKTADDPGNDLQYVDLVDPATGERITRILGQTINRDTWLFVQFDLTSLAGRNLRLVFGVINDGRGAKTALYVDNISLLACDSGAVDPATPIPTQITRPTPTPSITSVSTLPSPTITSTPEPGMPLASATATLPLATVPFATITPTVSLSPTVYLPPTTLPEGCSLTSLPNGGFEEAIPGSSGVWILGNDPVPAEIVAETYEGLRALRMGNPPDSGQPAIHTYSSARQLISIPASALTAKLMWAHKPSSQAAPNAYPAVNDDRQELILLTQELMTKRILYRQLNNDGIWRVNNADLTPFIGETFYIYFNVFNNSDSARSWMLLDAVRLEICFSAPTATPMPLPTLTPTVIAIFLGTTEPMSETVLSGDAASRVLAEDAPAEDAPGLILGFLNIILGTWWGALLAIAAVFLIWWIFFRK